MVSVDVLTACLGDRVIGEHTTARATLPAYRSGPPHPPLSSLGCPVRSVGYIDWRLEPRAATAQELRPESLNLILLIQTWFNPNRTVPGENEAARIRNEGVVFRHGIVIYWHCFIQTKTYCYTYRFSFGINITVTSLKMRYY